MAEDIFELRDRLYQEYDERKKEVCADANLSPGERDRAITALTDDLLAKEAEHGIQWKPLFEVRVNATGSGSVEIPIEKATKGEVDD